jgi:1,4-alpha-glucan branching enzyme
MNETVYQYHPDIMMMAEESTAFAGVSRPTYDNGLGFGMKWMMGWMHDTLNYFKTDPLFRKSVHDRITFSMIYNYSENYVLPFSHDEVVHGKGSLLSRMPGVGQDQFANLRLMLGYMFTHPGAKLLFMGCEFGQRSEWNFASQLEWNVLQYDSHKGIQAWVKVLNKLYQKEKSLHELCTQPAGFQWVRVDDWQQSVLAYERIAVDPGDKVLVLLNLTPVDREQYRIGTAEFGHWTLIDHSDKVEYWGQGRAVNEKVVIEEKTWEHKENSMEFSLPGLTVLMYKFTQGKMKAKAEAEAKEKLSLKVKEKVRNNRAAPAKKATTNKKTTPKSKTAKPVVATKKKASTKTKK